MAHNRQRLSAEEALLVACLLLSTSVITASFNLMPRRASQPVITRIDFASPASSVSSRPIDVASVAENGTQATLRADKYLTEPGLQSNRVAAPSDKSNGFIPIAVSHSYYADAPFPLSEVARTEKNNGRIRDGTIRVVRNLNVNGTRIGNLDVTVSAEGGLIFNSSQLKALLKTAGLDSWGTSLPEQDPGPVSTQMLRELGINLRYSPERDAFEISS
jgi:hypothetical protein